MKTFLLTTPWPPLFKGERKVLSKEIIGIYFMKSNWNIVCIQNFINSLDETTIPKAILTRIRSGYSNNRIVEDFHAMMIKAEIAYRGNNPIFIVPYCNLSLNIGLAHGLVLYQVLYPPSGYFANPENTLDEAYLQYLRGGV